MTNAEVLLAKRYTFNGQTISEEISNAVSHGLGALLAAAGTGIMVASAAIGGNAVNIISSSLYGLSLILLYLVSTLYHSMTDYRVKSIFRIFDHCSIFILIWGTYTPVALSLVGGRTGWAIFIFQTVCAVVGIILNAIDLNKWKGASLVLYVLMGWAIVINAAPVLSVVDGRAVAFLLGGGIAYTAGIYFYVLSKKAKYAHFVWHLFVLLGSVLQYFFVLGYCVR